MLVYLNKNLKFFVGTIILLLVFAEFVETKEKKKIYTDKLELIRDFILENYPINPEHYIKIETCTGLYQNFWNFQVTVGDLEVFEPPPLVDEDGKIIGQKKVEPEYGFEFHISSSYEILKFIASGSKIEEKLNIIKKMLKEEKGELTLEKIESLLKDMGALYPIDRNKIRKVEKSRYGMRVDFEKDFTKKIGADLLKRKSLWSFLNEGEPIIKEVFFATFILNDDYISFYWHLTVRIKNTEYSITIEPFHGYIEMIEKQ